MSAAPQAPSSSAGHNEAKTSSPTALSSMSPSNHLAASAVLIVPILDEKHHGADLLMIPISNNTQTSTEDPRQEPESRTATPAAPTPPPKPVLPEGCQDWESYLSQKKSSATLPAFDAREEGHQTTITSPRVQSPDLNFKHSFENSGWRDCLTQRQRHPAARPLRRRPSAATVIGALYAPTGLGSASASGLGIGLGSSSSTSGTPSLRSAKRLSNASTLTANTAMTAPPCLLSSRRSHKRLSTASTLTTLTTSSMASSSSSKPRSLRRINRTRHLRAYYSDERAVLRARRLSVGISSLRDISERREPAAAAAATAAHKRFSSASMPLCMGEFRAPPPYPPPEKPLPSLPVMEVRELQTRERTRWRELLLRSFQQGAWRRGISSSSGGRS